MQQPPNYGGWTQQPQQPNTQYPQQQWQSSPPGYQQSFQQPPMMPPQAPKKKSKVGLIVGIVVALGVLACIGAFALASNGGKNTSNTINTAATTVTTGTTPTTGSQSQGKWTTVQTFTGNGTKKTAVFSTPNDWKILYSCNGIFAGTATDGILGVSVYGSDNTPIDPAAVNTTCKAGSALTTGETEEHQEGQVYLDINGTGDWKITIQELK